MNFLIYELIVTTPTLLSYHRDPMNEYTEVTWCSLIHQCLLRTIRARPFLQGARSAAGGADTPPV